MNARILRAQDKAPLGLAKRSFDQPMRIRMSSCSYFDNQYAALIMNTFVGRSRKIA